MGLVVAPPDPTLTTTPTKEGLDAYLGQNISEICGSEYKNDADNHCAHFVSHVMGFSFGFTCKGMTGKGDKGYCIRVHEVFAQCPEVGKWEKRTATACLVFIIAGSSNVDLAAKTMANVPRKHIGIYVDGTIWHYSNSRDKVITQTSEEFSHHYSGSDVPMFYGTFPL